MDKHWQKVDGIPNIEKLQKTILDILIRRNINKMVPLRPLFADHVWDFIQANPHPVWDNLKIKNGLIFFSRPNSEQGLHVDGFTKSRTNAADVALNIPIYNCSQGTMHWYGGAEYTLEEREVNKDQEHKFGSRIKMSIANSKRGATKYLKLTWNGDPVEIDQTLVDQPCLVRIDVPHQAINTSNDRRIMLSLRFDPDLKFI